MNCDGLMRDCVLSHLGTRSNCAHGSGEGVRGRGWRGLVIDIFLGGGGGGGGGGCQKKGLQILDFQRLASL